MDRPDQRGAAVRGPTDGLRMLERSSSRSRAQLSHARRAAGTLCSQTMRGATVREFLQLHLTHFLSQVGVAQRDAREVSGCVFRLLAAERNRNADHEDARRRSFARQVCCARKRCSGRLSAEGCRNRCTARCCDHAAGTLRSHTLRGAAKRG